MESESMEEEQEVPLLPEQGPPHLLPEQGPAPQLPEQQDDRNNEILDEQSESESEPETQGKIILTILIIINTGNINNNELHFINSCFY